MAFGSDVAEVASQLQVVVVAASSADALAERRKHSAGKVPAALPSHEMELHLVDVAADDYSEPWY